MSFTEITPYGGHLPSSSDPASFDGRASALMSWLVANFAPEIQALAVEIATALNGEEDTLAAVQALSDSLKSAAHYNANDDEDFTLDPNALPTRAAVAGYVEALRGGTSLGWGQSWSDMKGSRSANAPYQNTTGRSIMVSIAANVPGNRDAQLSHDGSTWVNVGLFHSSAVTSSIFIVPNGHYYRINGSVTSIFTWAELR
ncbi:hypothetical protein [Celeribacter sp.]|uniref:hypothetical protein n=1 Tax=Celeribacter sp. TaxID=1890673 RepID=UPI003A959C6C